MLLKVAPLDPLNFLEHKEFKEHKEKFRVCIRRISHLGPIIDQFNYSHKDLMNSEYFLRKSTHSCRFPLMHKIRLRDKGTTKCPHCLELINRLNTIDGWCGNRLH